MKKLLLFLLVLVGPLQFLFAENIPFENSWLKQTAQSIFPGRHIWNETKTKAEQIDISTQYIYKLLPQTFQHNSSLKLDLYKVSPNGIHITYTQAFSGIAIYGTTVKINILKNGKVSSVLYKTVSTQKWDENFDKWQTDKKQLQSFAADNLISVAEPVWFLENIDNEPVAANRIEFGKNDGSKHTEAIYSTENALLYSFNKIRYHNKPDSVVTLFVFDPDPLTSAGKNYGTPYVDANDSAVFELDFERYPKQIRTAYKNDTFYLQGPYARITELSLPPTPPTTNTEAIFNYSRTEPGFEDANVFYHIHNYQFHIKALGFDTLGNFILPVDAHALGGDDNSQFDFFNADLKLLFGEGGIDDAEDADVIVHEYSHYLSYDAAGDNAYGGERLALEEGLADYFACTYSKAISTYNWQKVYSWDGNSTWGGRSCASNKRFPNDYIGNRWKDGEIWSSALMQIHDEIGREKTDKLMFAMLYNTARYMTMSDAAKIFMQGDTLMFQAENSRKIALAFIKHGLLPEDFLNVKQPVIPDFEPKINSYYFSTHCLIYIDVDEAQTCAFSLYDALGRQVFFQQPIYGNKFKIYTPRLAKGMYILRMNTPEIEKSYKLIKN